MTHYFLEIGRFLGGPESPQAPVYPYTIQPLHHLDGDYKELPCFGFSRRCGFQEWSGLENIAIQRERLRFGNGGEGSLVVGFRV